MSNTINWEWVSSIGSAEVKKRTYSIIQKLSPDYWLEIDIKEYKDAYEKNKTWIDLLTVLNWYAYTFKPKYYLEIGVRRGRSMAQVLVESPDTTAFGFDIWLPNYGSDVEKGIKVKNPGRDFVLKEFRNLGVSKEPTLIDGASQKTLGRFIHNPDYPREINLITVDGDHTYLGAKVDLINAFLLLAPGGALVFDDINHPSHMELGGLWEEFKAKYPDYLFIQDSYIRGIGVAFKPPFDYLFELDK